MPLKQLQPTIALLGWSQRLADQVDGTDSAVVERPATFGHLKMDIAATHHWFGLVTPPTRMIQSTGNSLLAVTHNFGVSSVHSKCFFLGWVSVSYSPANTSI